VQASGTQLDHNAAMSATRACLSCHRVYTAEQIERDPAWEPTRSGWRCGDCTRARRLEVSGRAAQLLAGAEEPWTLVRRDAEHGRSMSALTARRLGEAQCILLARGGRLTAKEADSLRGTVLSEG
jgi:hypothetical protein